MASRGYAYPTSFEQFYRCYSASSAEKPQVQSGDKVIMPPSALDRLAALDIEYPMLFQLQNPAIHRISHCGVLEFVAEEGMIYVPDWMMGNMQLEDGNLVKLKNVSLPKGTYVNMQPHTKEFFTIKNPKAVLENTLRSFSCLTIGDTIQVMDKDKKYLVDIVETKPSSAVSVIETDCEVEFAPPLDYKEPEKEAASIPICEDKSKDENEAKFSPFTGVGRSLNGKTVKHSMAPVTCPPNPDVRENKPSASSSSSDHQKRSKPGKLVFGSSVGNDEAQAREESAKEEVKEEIPNAKGESKFHAFTGKKHSLKE